MWINREISRRASRLNKPSVLAHRAQHVAHGVLMHPAGSSQLAVCRWRFTLCALSFALCALPFALGTLQ